MGDMRYYKIKPGTAYDTAVKKYFNLYQKWNAVYAAVGELLDEEITMMVRIPDYLQIEFKELQKEENKKLFKKDGKLKLNLKKAKEIEAAYKDIVKNAGLSEYQTIGSINFAYGLMRYSGETLKMFSTADHEIYYEADFDLEKDLRGHPVGRVCSYQSRKLSIGKNTLKN
ncbi:hypothetical protein [Paenibacillus lactis]|uniref:hypothetical protein n=1 Tax=Paenibacillus lactis TaxID=228574 RepID=UPI003D71FF89